MLGGHLNFNFNLYSSSCILSVIGSTTMTNNLMICHKHLVISLVNYLYVLNRAVITSLREWMRQQEPSWMVGIIKWYLPFKALCKPIKQSCHLLPISLVTRNSNWLSIWVNSAVNKHLVISLINYLYVLNRAVISSLLKWMRRQKPSWQVGLIKWWAILAV